MDYLSDCYWTRSGLKCLFASCRVIRFVVRHVKYFLGLRFQVSGWEHLQTDGPYVIISNHQSSLDVLGEWKKKHNQSTLSVFGITITTTLIYEGMVRITVWQNSSCQHDQTCMCSVHTQMSHMIILVLPVFLCWFSSSLQVWWRSCRTAARWSLRRSWYGPGQWAWFAGWEESSSLTAKRPGTPRTSWAMPLKPCWPIRSVTSDKWWFTSQFIL